MGKQNYRTALFVAWRYLFSKKKHSIVNIIAIISVIGVMAGSAALIIVLSVFNGMEDIVVSSFNSFNPDLKITLKEGKSFPVGTFPIEKIKQINGVKAAEDVVSDLVLMEYNGKQHLIDLKGISDDYSRQSGFDTLLVDGSFCLHNGDVEGGVLGAISAGLLQVNLNDQQFYKIYYPKRLRKNLGSPTDAFNTRYLQHSGVFQSFTEYDNKYLICSIGFARELMSYNGEATSIEVFLHPNADTKSIQKEVEKIVGNRFVVKNRFQQEELLFKTMKGEKLMIFAILSFILLIAIFNIIGTLAMIIIEKKEDTAILNYIGANQSLIRKIFLTEGIIISFIGGIVGMLFGTLVCFIQQTFHIIRYGDGIGGGLEYYPVKMDIADFGIVFITIFIISLLASVIPLHQVKNTKDTQYEQ